MALSSPGNLFVSVAISGTGGFSISQSGSFFSVSQDSASAPASLTVGLTNTTCSAGGTIACNGSIRLHPTGVSGTAQDLVIPVSFTPGSGGGGGGGTQGSIVASPASVILTASTNQSVATTVSLSTSSVQAIGFSITTSPANGSSWLSVTPTSGSISSSTPVTLTVFGNAFGITTNQSGNITISPTGGSQTTIPVSLNVTGGSGTGSYTLSPPSISFSNTSGPTSQQVVVFNTLGVQTFNVQTVNCTGGNFLLVNGGLTSGLPVANGLSLVLTNTGAFATGTYTCQVVVSNPNNFSDQTTLPVTLTVNGGSQGNTYTVSQTQVNFANQAAGSTNTQTTTLGVSSSTATTYNATFTPSSGGQWLYLNNQTSQIITNQPVANGLTLSIAQPQFLAAGTYSGTVTLSNPNGTGTNTSIGVSLVVGGGGSTGGSYTVSNGNLTFSYPSGSTSASLSVSSPSQSFFNVTTSSSGSVNNWLSAGQAGGFPGTFISNATTSLPLNLFVIPDNVPTVIGTYSGQVKISNPSNSNDFATVNVTLQVTSGSSSGGSSATPTLLNFSTTPGSAPPAQNVAVTVPSGASFTTTINGSNIFAIPCNGCTYNGSQSLPVTISGGLGAGNYSSSIVLTSNGVQFATIQVNLTVSTTGGTGGGLVGPSSLSFAYQTGQSTSPAQQTVTIAPSGAFTATSSQPWLIVSPQSGNGPANLTVSVIPFGLSAGNQTGTINVTTPSGSQSVNVTLAIGSSTVLYANPGSITFTTSATGSYQTFVQITTSDNSNASVTASAQQTWITLDKTTGVTPGTSTFLVTANPSGLCNGLNVGSINFTAAGASNSPLSIPVVALVSGSSTTSCSSSGTLTISPSTLTYTAAANGSTPASQSLNVTAPSSGTSYTVSTSVLSGGTNWLAVTAPCNNCTLSGNTTLIVSVNQTGLAAGSYQGNVILTTNGVSQTVPVTLTVGASGASGNITVSPTGTLTFTGQVNGSAPAGQNVTVTSTTSGVGFLYTVVTSSGGNWLSATSNGSTLTNGQALITPNTITIVANPGNLAAGTYSGTITLSPNGGTAVSIPVTLTVSNNAVSATPSSLTFNYQAGDAAPTSQTIQVSGQPGLTYTVQTNAGTCGAGSLVVPGATSGTIPASGSVTIPVNINPVNLNTGTCNASLTIAGSGSATGSTTIPVSITVTAPLPRIDRVTSAASFIGQTISPGEVITIFGTGLGPTPFQTLAVDSNTGRVTTSLGGVQVLVSGFPAPMVFASNTQVSAVVPYEIAPLQSATVIVRFLGQTSNGISVGVSPTAPGIFTANSAGSGPGAILNQNNTSNSPANPANKGETISIYVTGEGQTSPAGVSGKVTTVSPTGPLTPVPLLPVAVLIDGLPAAITFAGEAPSLISGVMQVNAQIPAAARSGNVPLVVSVGGVNSQNGVTVSVR